MAALWPWLAIAALGALHGLSPANGWLLAAACGVHARDEAHAHLDASGVATTVLHHAVPNPLSAPFWARQGYRPVLTQWVRHLPPG